LKVIRVNRANYIASNGVSDFLCEVTGKFSFQSEGKGDFPTAGDWVIASEILNAGKAI